MYDDEFELTFDMAEDNAETVKLPGKPLQPAPEAPEPPEPAGKAKEPEVPDFPDDEPTIVIPARKPREMPKQEREPVRAEPVAGAGPGGSESAGGARGGPGSTCAGDPDKRADGADLRRRPGHRCGHRQSLL